MNEQGFLEVLDKTLAASTAVLTRKAAEYATDDRLHNFKVAAALQGIPSAAALAGMMAKHTVSVYDMAVSGRAYLPTLWDEKIVDHINYLLLLRALVTEEGLDKPAVRNDDVEAILPAFPAAALGGLIATETLRQDLVFDNAALHACADNTVYCKPDKPRSEEAHAHKGRKVAGAADKKPAPEPPAILAELAEYVDSHKEVTREALAQALGVKWTYLQRVLSGLDKLSVPLTARMRMYLDRAKGERAAEPEPAHDAQPSTPAPKETERPVTPQEEETRRRNTLRQRLRQHRKDTKTPLYAIAAGCGMGKGQLLDILEGRVPAGVDYSKIERYLAQATTPFLQAAT